VPRRDFARRWLPNNRGALTPATWGRHARGKSVAPAQIDRGLCPLLLDAEIHWIVVTPDPTAPTSTLEKPDDQAEKRRSSRPVHLIATALPRCHTTRSACFDPINIPSFILDHHPTPRLRIRLGRPDPNIVSNQGYAASSHVEVPSALPHRKPKTKPSRGRRKPHQY
jgi:hypothetical protein